MKLAASTRLNAHGWRSERLSKIKLFLMKSLPRGLRAPNKCSSAPRPEPDCKQTSHAGERRECDGSNVVVHGERKQAGRERQAGEDKHLLYRIHVAHVSTAA
jgi:hypothetical protein